MTLTQKIKFRIIKSRLEKTKKKYPFDQLYAEGYQLAPDAPATTNNSYYFSAHDQNGVSLLLRIGIRNDSSELWFVYRNAAGKTYKNIEPQLTASSKAGAACLEPGKKWGFYFSGKVAEVESNEIIQVSFEAEFVANAPIFEFSRHMHPDPIARTLAREKWTKEFRTSLQENHQVHYEQSGNMTGTLHLGGEKLGLDMPIIRDHSFGKRDWNYMDRHVWLAMLMETGEVLNISLVRYPAVFELQAGYFEQNGVITCVSQATPMDQITMKGEVPQKFSLDVVLVDGTKLIVECEKETAITFSMGDGAYRIIEGIGNMTVNGVKARGILEFGYNADPQRWSR